MKIERLPFLVLVASISLLAAIEGSEADGKTPAAYIGEIEKFRDDYWAKFIDKDYSPIRTDEDLSKLCYYQPDPAFRFRCQFLPAGDESPVKMVTTMGQVAPFIRFAWLTFEYADTTHRLAVYKRDYDGPDYYFIPFRDRTNGEGTYDGVRYLEFKIEEVENGMVELDFNRCYNPWCHYDEKLECPLPPMENTLSVEIRAGEKKYAFDGKREQSE